MDGWVRECLEQARRTSSEDGRAHRRVGGRRQLLQADLEASKCELRLGIVAFTTLERLLFGFWGAVLE